MGSLFLAPHNLGDDETLFASFLILKHRPRVIVCLRSDVQLQRYGITAIDRVRETTNALGELDRNVSLNWTQWAFSDATPDWGEIRVDLLAVEHNYRPDLVFAPALEEDGHDHHNRIGALALEVFGPDRVTSYLTYTRSHGRSTQGVEVVPEPDWIERKHRALACYRSQIAEPSCRPWFLGDLREYVAE